MRPPFNLEAVEQATIAGMAKGHRVLQSHRYADTDAGHVAYLLDIMKPAEGGIVLDAGCGIGEVSRLMAEMRPDLAFVMVNVSPLQLSHCPVGEQFMGRLEDCHDLNMSDECVDAVMFSSALCQMDAPVVLAEAARVLKDGGVLLINDMACTSDDGGAMEQILAARVLPQDELVAIVKAAGFVVDRVLIPKFDDNAFRELLASDGLEHLLDGVFPIIIRATKGEVA